MTRDVITEFLEHDADTPTRELLLETLRDLKVGRKYLVFNAFNVLLDLESGQATVEDALEADRQESMPLTAFAQELRRLGTA